MMNGFQGRKNVIKRLSEHRDKRAAESGSALIYILIAIALLALLTITFMEPSSQQTQTQNTFKLVSSLESQIEFIRSSVQECILSHPGGDINTDTSGGGTDPGADHRYPLKPNSARLSTPAADRKVKNIRCPGNPGDAPNHAVIYGGTTGKFLPPPPDLFSDWQWYNGTDGVFFWIETDKSDAFIQTALQKLDEKYGDCESDIIDATAAAVDLDSDTTVACSNGSTCFRVWMVAELSAVYPDGCSP